MTEIQSSTLSARSEVPTTVPVFQWGSDSFHLKERTSENKAEDGNRRKLSYKLPTPYLTHFRGSLSPRQVKPLVAEVSGTGTLYDEILTNSCSH